ncbi:TPA: hypothetical protein UMZ04_000696 [Stenotrophomonas maltophilia]|uniref:hypothetical protein n=1 Tax=Stenotrophomonas maltophilia TaxID=40324 RepID=UPI00066CDB57|nr:hypothetical protein [Stenotrophomonas maltophilia]EKU9965972.1 hypothetical protein [Stenotrophomonas maltophilia]MBH1646859.1 hypothetical protein [Stenotrophomonas maltophilia]MBH1783070.1 hypothetical protein [Stenotrophomonas maltophilia]HDS1188786.1 hypothetical protein [Stenotrophomonas maltophilia]HEL3766781.1 hypothetical protein [Stenotrophomonas maltophilia]
MNIKNARYKLAAVSAIGMTALASAPAFAGELASAATEGMDKAELILIGVAVLSLCGVIALIRAGRRASS